MQVSLAQIYMLFIYLILKLVAFVEYEACMKNKASISIESHDCLILSLGL